ncbi:unnamed protein product [Closterium sp. Naga37s-1]|nr:unnamed protein product [Closterium sp. Naga37s-1]
MAPVPLASTPFPPSSLSFPTHFFSHPLLQQLHHQLTSHPNQLSSNHFSPHHHHPHPSDWKPVLLSALCSSLSSQLPTSLSSLSSLSSLLSSTSLLASSTSSLTPSSLSSSSLSIAERCLDSVEAAGKLLRALAGAGGAEGGVSRLLGGGLGSGGGAAAGGAAAGGTAGGEAGQGQGVAEVRVERLESIACSMTTAFFPRSLTASAGLRFWGSHSSSSSGSGGAGAGAGGSGSGSSGGSASGKSPPLALVAAAAEACLVADGFLWQAGGLLGAAKAAGDVLAVSSAGGLSGADGFQGSMVGSEDPWALQCGADGSTAVEPSFLESTIDLLLAVGFLRHVSTITDGLPPHAHLSVGPFQEASAAFGGLYADRGGSDFTAAAAAAAAAGAAAAAAAGGVAGRGTGGAGVWGRVGASGYATGRNNDQDDRDSIKYDIRYDLDHEEESASVREAWELWSLALTVTTCMFRALLPPPSLSDSLSLASSSGLPFSLSPSPASSSLSSTAARLALDFLSFQLPSLLAALSSPLHPSRSLLSLSTPTPPSSYASSLLFPHPSQGGEPYGTPGTSTGTAGGLGLWGAKGQQGQAGFGAGSAEQTKPGCSAAGGKAGLGVGDGKGGGAGGVRRLHSEYTDTVAIEVYSLALHSLHFLTSLLRRYFPSTADMAGGCADVAGMQQWSRRGVGGGEVGEGGWMGGFGGGGGGVMAGVMGGAASAVVVMGEGAPVLPAPEVLHGLEDQAVAIILDILASADQTNHPSSSTTPSQPPTNPPTFNPSSPLRPTTLFGNPSLSSPPARSSPSFPSSSSPSSSSLSSSSLPPARLAVCRLLLGVLVRALAVEVALVRLADPTMLPSALRLDDFDAAVQLIVQGEGQTGRHECKVSGGAREWQELVVEATQFSLLGVLVRALAVEVALVRLVGPTMLPSALRLDDFDAAVQLIVQDERQTRQYQKGRVVEQGAVDPVRCGGGGGARQHSHPPVVACQHASMPALHVKKASKPCPRYAPTAMDWQRQFPLLVAVLLVALSLSGDVIRPFTASPAASQAQSGPESATTAAPVAASGAGGAAQQVRQILSDRYPDLEVSLGNHPPPAYCQVLSKLLSAAQMAAMAVIFAGDSLLPAVGLPPPFPQWYEQIRTNRLGSAATVWIMGNVIHGSLASTGAFELVLDGRTPAKIASNPVPNPLSVTSAMLPTSTLMLSSPNAVSAVLTARSACTETLEQRRQTVPSLSVSSSCVSHQLKSTFSGFRLPLARSAITKSVPRNPLRRNRNLSTFRVVASSNHQAMAGASGTDTAGSGDSSSGLVVCFGEMLIDFVPTVNGVSLAEAPAFMKAPGGAPANVAVGIARLGGRAAFMGKVGEDEFGHMLGGILKTNGVDTSALRFDAGARTALAFVTLRSDGEREFMFYRNPSADMLLQPEELDLPLATSASVLHYGSISLITDPCKSAHLALLDAVETSSNTVLSYDPNLRIPLWPSQEAARDGILSIWNRAHIIKVSDEEVAFLTNGGDPYSDDVARSLFNLSHKTSSSGDGKGEGKLRLLLVTEGEKGCRYYTEQYQGRVDGFSVAAIDTTGAGDAFVAGFLRKLAGGSSSGFAALDSLLADEAKLKEALLFANACGAITTTVRGAIPALPDEMRVAQMLG